MPIVFLVGIATAATALTEAVSRRISNLLETTTFFVEPGVGAFNALARGVSYSVRAGFLLVLNCVAQNSSSSTGLHR